MRRVLILAPIFLVLHVALLCAQRAAVVPDGRLLTRQENDLRIHFLNVGSGSCAVVECPGPNAPPMIVDCGSSGGTTDDLTQKQTGVYIQRILQQNPSAPNVVLSHADIDHYDYVPSSMAQASAQEVWLGGDPDDYTESGFPGWLETQKGIHSRFDANWHNNRRETELSCGFAKSYVLTVNTEGPRTNANSLVLMLAYQDFKAIFTGDAEGVTEAQVIRNFGNAIKATVLMASHHGAQTHGSNSSAWAEAVAPDILISSAGEKYFHPRCNAMERFTTLAHAPAHAVRCGEDRRYQVFTTDKAQYVTEVDGAIIVTTNGHSPLSVLCTKAPNCAGQIPYEPTSTWPTPTGPSPVVIERVLPSRQPRGRGRSAEHEYGSDCPCRMVLGGQAWHDVDPSRNAWTPRNTDVHTKWATHA